MTHMILEKQKESECSLYYFSRKTFKGLKRFQSNIYLEKTV